MAEKETRKITGTLTRKHPAWFFPYDKSLDSFTGIIPFCTIYKITLPTNEVYVGRMRGDSPFLQENSTVLLEYMEGSEEPFKEPGKIWVDIISIMPSRNN